MRLLWIALLLTAATGCVKRFSLVEAPIDKSWTSPQVVRFSASPQVIHHGETAVLTWSVRNVSRVMLEEALEPDGSLSDRYLHSIGDFAANGNCERVAKNKRYLRAELRTADGVRTGMRFRICKCRGEVTLVPLLTTRAAPIRGLCPARK
jgi:hypothetical protein